MDSWQSCRKGRGSGETNIHLSVFKTKIECVSLDFHSSEMLETQGEDRKILPSLSPANVNGSENLYDIKMSPAEYCMNQLSFVVISQLLGGSNTKQLK